jgi:hypothetical protein
MEGLRDVMEGLRGTVPEEDSGSLESSSKVESGMKVTLTGSTLSKVTHGASLHSR